MIYCWRYFLPYTTHVTQQTQCWLHLINKQHPFRKKNQNSHVTSNKKRKFKSAINQTGATLVENKFLLTATDLCHNMSLYLLSEWLSLGSMRLFVSCILPPFDCGFDGSGSKVFHRRFWTDFTVPLRRLHSQQ